MPKHIHSDHYFTKPHELVPNGTIHPEIQHHDHGPDTEHYLLPAVWRLEKGDGITLNYPGPGVYYIIEGEIQYEDTADPGTPHKLGPGAVVHVDQGSTLHWHSPSVAKGFGVFHVPVSIKGFESFVVSK